MLESVTYNGVLLRMFIAGLETDTVQLLKVGKASALGARFAARRPAL